MDVLRCWDKDERKGEYMKVAVSWEMCGFVDIPGAKTVEEAMTIFKQESDCIKLPMNGLYVDGSFQLSTNDVDEMESMVS